MRSVEPSTGIGQKMEAGTVGAASVASLNSFSTVSGAGEGLSVTPETAAEVESEDEQTSVLTTVAIAVEGVIRNSIAEGIDIGSFFANSSLDFFTLAESRLSKERKGGGNLGR